MRCLGIGGVLENLQEFAKSTWHPFIFGKTEKIVLQLFGI
jgi:hypothetical protein